MKKLLPLLILLVSSSIQAQDLYFPPLDTNAEWETIDPSYLNYCEEQITELYDFLDQSNSKAFILLKDGKIVLEKYFDDFTVDSFWLWNSAGKTVTAMLTGIAQQEGKLSINDPSSDYMGTGWTNLAPEQEEKITVLNQLTMTSGLDDGVPDVHCTLDTCLNYKADPDTRWAYHNAPYTLLDEVIGEATGVSLNIYLQQKLKSKTGMTGAFLKFGYNNVLVSQPRSMARFGLLMLNKGTWNNTPILTDTTYYQSMINSSQDINPSYGYLWWLNGKSSFMLPSLQVSFPGSVNPDGPDDAYAGLGKDGQIVFVVPSQNMVWIRMGQAPVNTGFVPNQYSNDIWKQINALECAITSTTDPEFNNNQLKVFPNPAADQITISVDQQINHIELYDASGRLINALFTDQLNIELSTEDLQSGIYFLKVRLDNDVLRTERFIKR